MLRVVLLLVCFRTIVAEHSEGARGLGVGDTVQGWKDSANDKYASTKDSAKDKYASTKEWASGTKADAAASYEDSKKRVEAKKEKIRKSMAAAYNATLTALSGGKDKAVAATKEAWKEAYPTCTDLRYVVRSQVDAKLSSMMDDVFAAQVCLNNVSSAACLTLIEDTLVHIIFKSLFAPVEEGIGLTPLGVVSPAVAILGIEQKTKAYFRPHILIVAKPPASMIHKELVKLDTDTTNANKTAAAAKVAMTSIKDDVTRRTENSMGKLCDELGLLARTEETTEASAAHQLFTFRHAFFLVSVVTVTLNSLI